MLQTIVKVGYSARCNYVCKGLLNIKKAIVAGFPKDDL
jgi:hypothetical protein